jgi:4-amino-4-deoxy-L-arabinose transferase-like glycosyltransferase
LVDVGRELYTAWQVSEGAVLYRDIWLPRGPFSSYANGLLFAAFAPSMMTLALANLVWLGLGVGLLHWHVRRDHGVGTAFVATFVLLSVFAFSRYSSIGNYNFVLPYAHEVTHGIVLSIVAMALVLRALEPEVSVGWAFAGGLVLGLVLLTKQEVALAAVVATAVTMASARARTAVVAGVAAGAALTLAITLAMLGSDPFVMMWGLPVADVVRQSPFYLANLGLDAPTMRLAAVALATAFLLLEGAAVAIIARWLHGAARTTVAAAYAIWLGLHWLPFALGVVSPMSAWLLAPAVLLPVSVAVAGVSFGLRLRGGREREAGAFLCWLSVFAVMMLLKTGLSPRVHHYGFAVSLPAAIVFVVLALDALPRRLAPFVPGRTFARLAFATLVLAFCGFSLQLSHHAYAKLDKTVGQGGDAFRVRRDDQSHGRVLALLTTSLRSTDSLLVLPEGVFYNYLLRVESPTPHISFMPLELELTGESRIVADLVARPPDRVLWVARDVQEYGYRAFGEPGYGNQIIGWLRSDYLRQNRHGARYPGLFERRPTATR